MDNSFMVNIYADAIQRGRKTLEQVPANLREQVEAALNANRGPDDVPDTAEQVTETAQDGAQATEAAPAHSDTPKQENAADSPATAPETASDNEEPGEQTEPVKNSIEFTEGVG